MVDCLTQKKDKKVAKIFGNFKKKSYLCIVKHNKRKHENY